MNDTNINKRNNINNRNNPKENINANNISNSLLTNNYYQKIQIFNNKSYENYIYKEGNNMDNNRRKNHTVFVRVEMKNQDKKAYNNINNNKKENYPIFTKYLDSNTNNLKSPNIKTPIPENENYRKSNSLQIPQTKSFKSNYLRKINSINNLNNKEYLENNKNLKNPITPNVSNQINNRFNIRNRTSSKEDEIDEQIEQKENLMNIVNKQIGIINLGNTCFINSSLQIFLHCPLLIHKLIKKEKLINENTPITSNFISICNLMLNTRVKFISIHEFKNLLGLNHKIFSGYMQHDSQEFSRIFLEDISRELNEVKINSLYRMLSNSDSKSKIMRDRDFHENFSRREKSIITEIFYAQIINIYTCKCNSKIFSFQKILDFPLLFPNYINNNIISLNELLKLYFSIEYIEFESKCTRCNKIEKHKKELKISRPPEILILSLQRVDLFTGKKLQYKVKFSQQLDLYEFVDHECGYDRECKYDLFGVINHLGSINSGHYYSYIMNENKEWIEYNDSKVREINNFNDCSEAVYALFYMKEKYNNSKIFKR